MAGQYAAGTQVPADRSRAEIEKTLDRYGATSYVYGRDDDRRLALLMFKAHDRQIRFVLPLPNITDREFAFTATRQERSAEATRKAFEQEVRRRWRALALAIKAKLEVVESGIIDFESEFAAHIVLPDQSTVGDWLRPQIAEAYATGVMPEMLPGVERLAITDGTN